MKQLLLVGAFFLVLTGTGCSKMGSTTSDAAQTAMGHYAEGYNGLVDQIQSRIIDTYFEHIPEDGPEAMNSRLLPFPQQDFVTNSLRKAKDSFAAGKTAAPVSMQHVPALADELLSASESVTNIFSQAQQYYSAENFKDDDGAKGRELHSQMVQQTGRFREAVDAFDEAIDIIEDEQMEASLKEYEAEKSYSYWFRKMTMDAKKLVMALKTSEEITGIDLALNQVEQTAAGLTAFVESKGGKTRINQSFQSYTDAADRFMVVVARLKRAARRDPPDMKAVGTEADNIITNYNTMISIGNALYQLEEYDQLK